MTRVYHGRTIPLDVYHGVPRGWRAGEIRREHSKLGGTYDLDGPDALEPGAPSFLPDRYKWLQYRQTLYRVVEGVRQGDLACVEIAVRYIELHHVGSYSGYVRVRLARALKSAALSEAQKRRLHDHLSAMIIKQEKVDEFKDYLKLWRLFVGADRKSALLAKVRSMPAGDARADWLSSRLG